MEEQDKQEIVASQAKLDQKWQQAVDWFDSLTEERKDKIYQKIGNCDQDLALFREKGFSEDELQYLKDIFGLINIAWHDVQIRSLNRLMEEE